MYAIATKITSLASAQNAPIYFLHEYGWGLLSGQCLTEEPGIILIQVQIPSAAKDFSP